MNTNQTSQASNVIAFPTAKRNAQKRGDYFRSEAMQDVFRARWNAAQAKLNG